MSYCSKFAQGRVALLRNRKISDMLGSNCVKTHLKTIFSRLEVSSRSKAVAIALREKLLDS